MWKRRIIIIFTVLTTILVLLMTRLSYYFVRELYLDQLTDHVRTVTMLLADRIDERNLDLLSLGYPPQSLKSYFTSLFENHTDAANQSEVFIFEKNFQVVVGSGSPISRPGLKIYRQEIMSLQTGRAVATLPFKGDDGNWYLWGFGKLSEQYWLATRESADRLQRVEEFSLLFWYIGLAGIVITVLIAWLMARAITRPLERLVGFSEAIGRGVFDEPAPEKTKGEIRVLTGAMDKMRRDIKEHQREKEEILAQIAHEIRNPLGGIELMTSLLREDLTGTKTDTKYLDRISAEVGGLKDLITSYLAFSRPQKADAVLIEPRAVFSDVADLVNERIKKKNIRLEINDSCSDIWFDPGQLKQILLNLVNNALDSVENGGTVVLFAKSTNRGWQMGVRDDGEGIAADHMEHIFDPFFTTRNEGTGLGLAICRKLCSENNTLLSVENNEQKGCTFLISKEGAGEK